MRFRFFTGVLAALASIIAPATLMAQVAEKPASLVADGVTLQVHQVK